MKDPRNAQLAKVFVDHSVKVQKGDKVVISTSDLEPIDLLREVYKLSLQRGAEVYLDIMGMNFFLDRSSYGDLVSTLYENSTIEQIMKPSSIYKNIAEWGDKHIRLTSINNYSHQAKHDHKKKTARAKSYHEWFRTIIDERKWVLTYYPTDAMAQMAGMSTSSLLDFYFNACLVDYDEMARKGKKVADLLDKANKVRIKGYKTDLTIDIEGRLAAVSSGRRNVPDGETYLAPVHKKTQGHIFYDLPFVKGGEEINGAFLEFKNGKVVKATAQQGESALLNGLDTDEGARYLGELGIGLNYGITDVMKNTLFDEKIGGTVHVTLGESYLYERGGAPDDPNPSAIHWDLVMDTRKTGSTIELDGKVMFEDGKWEV